MCLIINAFMYDNDFTVFLFPLAYIMISLFSYPLWLTSLT